MKKFLTFFLVSVGVCFFFSSASTAAPISNPETIEVLGIVSFGENGAAWLRVGIKDVLVTPGYLLDRELRVVAIRHEGVVLYQANQKKYIVLEMAVPDSYDKHHQSVVWCMPMPLWKVIRMVALAYGKDYICHSETRAEAVPRNHVANMFEMLSRCVTPHHRFRGREGIIYVCPVHVRNADWTHFLEQVRVFNSRRLVKYFPPLENRGTVISDGKELFDILKDIESKTRVSIRWDKPFSFPIYCSLKDRPWHQILENILLFNGLSIYPQANQLVIASDHQ